METCYIAQSLRGPDYPRLWSAVRRRRLHILASFKPSEPGISFVSSHVPTGCLILGPGGERVVPQLFTALRSFEVLLYRLAHKQMSRAMPGFGKSKQAALGLGVELQGSSWQSRHAASLSITRSRNSINAGAVPAPIALIELGTITWSRSTYAA